MGTKAIEQLLDEMFSTLEDLETKAAATFLFLKDQGHATDQELAPYLEQAGNASNVRWRAARLRMTSLLSSAVKNFEASKDEAKSSTAVAQTPEAKTDDAKQTEPETMERPEKRQEPRPASQAKDSTPTQNTMESAKAAQGPSREDQAPGADERQATSNARDPAGKSAPSSPEEAAKAPPSAERNDLQKSKEDAA
jgi:hypothetical protein